MLEPKLATPLTVTVLALVIGLFVKVDKLLTIKSCGLTASSASPPPFKTKVSIFNRLPGELIIDKTPPVTVKGDE